MVDMPAERGKLSLQWFVTDDLSSLQSDSFLVNVSRLMMVLRAISMVLTSCLHKPHFFFSTYGITR